MCADIACAACREQGVGQSMEGNVGVRVPGQLLIMFDEYAGKHHTVAWFESMYIIAVPGAHVRKCGILLRQAIIGHFDILCPGQFRVVD